MSGRPLAPALLAAALGLAALPSRAEQPQQVSAKELVRLGFFQDFAELDLEQLLEPEAETSRVAGGREQPLAAAPGAVSVADELRVRNLGARTLEELLRTLPGVDIVIDSLGRGQVVIRGHASGFGASSENVLVILNGQRLNEAINGGATAINLDTPVAGIKRLELLRGPASALYGNGALAGVVLIETESPGALQGASASVALGNFGREELGLQIGSELRGVSIAGSIQFLDLDGTGLLVPADAQTRIDGAQPGQDPISLAPGRVSDARRTLETVYRVGYRAFELGWRVKQERSDGFVGLTGALGRQNDLNNRQAQLDLSWRGELPGRLGLQARVGWTQNQIRRLLELFPPNYTVDFGAGRFILPSGVLAQTALDSDRIGGEAQLQFDRGRHRLVGGVALEREWMSDAEARSNFDLAANRPLQGLEPLEGVFDTTARTTFSVWAQDSFELGSPQLTLTGAVRLDHLSDVKTLASPRLAAVLPAGGVTLKAIYGRGFRAPSFLETSARFGGVIGDPELEPVTNDTLEALVVWEGAHFELSGGPFLSLVRDTIEPAGVPSLTEPVRLRNGRGYDVLGVSLEARGSLGEHTLLANLTLQRPEDLESDARLADQPVLLATLGGTFLVRDRYSVTPTLVVRSSRPRAPLDPREDLGGHAILNLTLRGRNVWRNLELRATIQNLFDTEYFDPSPLNGVPGDHPRPGFGVLFHATYRF